MRLQITGGTGYIGRHVVRHALTLGHEVELLTRRPLPAGLFSSEEERCLRVQQVEDLRDSVADPAAKLIHLAWDNVGSYKDARLVTQTLPQQAEFLLHMAATGCTDMTVAGTCLEYGLHDGLCSEDTPCTPVTYYGLAKLALFNTLSIYARQNPGLSLKWLRYFYIYGEGQREGSLFGQLAKAIADKKEEFPMSPADQQRDFINVSQAAHHTVCAATQNAVSGIINIGSGQARSVLEQAQRLKGDAPISFKTGVYPYPDYEPFSFWADTRKLATIPGVRFDENHL